ncbi:DNA-binding transcriptional LysR family regulator [Kibdelosporangium banguiense]|uniref:DNA-binding transcriptional LysR family regulator n=1 Tax=Kibdelosporangium banguiense TaxID=1365924 RepID=A0ABS4TTS9_9PSEU|nr:LysR family transcriptional regulator [Kibdelosporangium banguiense]MBP2327368.1 DNA-binding transcriptional LysR family regulator [Kibdelosporangium banguiense]
MLDVRKLRLLRELAHRGTIVAVAEALSYTPSAVSQQLTALERETGVPLLERTGRRVQLTPAALGLVEHTESILAILQKAAAELASTALTGTLRIGVFPTAVQTILTPAIVALSTEHPGLDLMVAELDPASVPDALREESLDVALVQEYDYVPVVSEPGLQTEPLLEETLHLAALTAGPLTAWRDSPWIAGTPGTLCHAMTVRACEATGFVPRIRHHADDFGAVLALMAAGQGVAFVPDLGAVAAPATVVLTPLPIRRRTHLAYRRGTGDHPAISAARLALQRAADQMPNGLA